MKKTLITLLALGCCAMGLTLEDADYTTTESSITLNPTLSSYSAILTLDVGALKNVMIAGAELSKHTLVEFDGGTGGDIGLQTNYSSQTTNGVSSIRYSGIYGSWNGGSAYSFGMDAGAVKSGMEAESFWTNAVGASAALMYTGSESTGLITIAYSDGSTKTLGGTWNTSLWSSSISSGTVSFDAELVTKAWVYSSGLNVKEATALTVAAIPEPATATLSLLALAGLAVRRRRK